MEAQDEAWVSAVKVADAKGYKQRYRKAAGAADIAKMNEQNRLVSQRSFGMPNGYERIQWGKAS